MEGAGWKAQRAAAQLIGRRKLQLFFLKRKGGKSDTLPVILASLRFICLDFFFPNLRFIVNEKVAFYIFSSYSQLFSLFNYTNKLGYYGWYNTMQRDTTPHHTTRYDMIRYNTIQYDFIVPMGRFVLDSSTDTFRCSYSRKNQ